MRLSLGKIVAGVGLLPVVVLYAAACLYWLCIGQLVLCFWRVWYRVFPEDEDESCDE